MPAKNSYILYSTVSQQFRQDMYSTLQQQRIAGVNWQNPQNGPTAHLTIGTCMGMTQNTASIAQSKSAVKSQVQTLLNTKVKNSTFLKPVDVIVTPSGWIFLEYSAMHCQDSTKLQTLHDGFVSIAQKERLNYQTQFSGQNFKTHLTIGKVANTNNIVAITALIQANKQKLLASFEDKPLNLFELKLMYNVDGSFNNTETLITKPVALRDYGVQGVHQTQKGNQKYTIVSIDNATNASKCTTFLNQFGIHKDGTKNTPKLARQSLQGGCTLRLTHQEYSQVRFRVKNFT